MDCLNQISNNVIVVIDCLHQISNNVTLSL